MKIVVIASTAYSLINLRGSLLAAMVGAGHEVVACAPGDDREVIDALGALGVACRCVPMERSGRNPLRDLQTLANLVAMLRSEKPDVVLAYRQKPIIYGGLAARLAGYGRFYAMVTGLGYAFTGDAIGVRPLRGLVVKLYRLALRSASAVIVFNRDDRGELLKNGIIRYHQKVLQVPGSGVDTVRFAQRPLPDGPPVFLMIARLLRSKGIAEFFEAARRVRTEVPNARFQLIGPLDSGPDGATMDEIGAWTAAGGVDYLGATRDVRPALAGATAFVLPTYYREGLPRTLLEAMAVGRAIVTTDAPGCRETVEPGRNGFLVPKRDPVALADAILCIARDPDLAARMGERSRQIAEARFDVDRVNETLLAAMELTSSTGPGVPSRGAPVTPGAMLARA